jgi:hypothetical protein
MERFLGREEVLGFHGEKGRRKKGVELGVEAFGGKFQVVGII